MSVVDRLEVEVEGILDTAVEVPMEPMDIEWEDTERSVGILWELPDTPMVAQVEEGQSPDTAALDYTFHTGYTEAVDYSLLYITHIYNY